MYAEKNLTRREAAFSLGEQEMAPEHAGRPARYYVLLPQGAASLEAVINPASLPSVIAPSGFGLFGPRT